MKRYAVAESLDLNTAASQSAIQTIGLDNPFHPGADVVAAFSLEGAAGTAFILEGREDSTGAWSTLAQVVAADGAGTFFKNVTLTQEIRATVTGAAGAGITGNLYLLGN